jgi:RNA polymerase sigma-70 factor (ECF subfamily)
LALRVANRYARNSFEAEDLAQEALIRAWRNREKLRDPERWEEWLAQIARNEALRGMQRRVPIPAEIEEQGEEDSRLEDLVESAELQTALASLSENDRQILMLRYAEDLTQPGVAERLGIGESAAKVRLSRARRKLAEHLDYE